MTNHDLVLSDLRLGGGVILPAPEDCLYVFDEGHQLPGKCLNHFALRFHAGATLQGLRDSDRWIRQSVAGWERAGLDERLSPLIASLLGDLQQRTEEVTQLLWDQFPEEVLERAELRFEHGRVPDALGENAVSLGEQWRQLHREVSRLEASLENSRDNASGVSQDTDTDLVNVQSLIARAEQQVALWPVSYTHLTLPTILRV